MKNRRLAIAVTAASVAHPTLALAQDAETIELAPVLVESATRTEIPLDETTKSVTVVTREEVETQKRIDSNVGDILSKTVPGFSPSNEANTNYGQTLRGRDFLTLIDGVPQSTPLRNGYRSLNTIDPESIERIEVVRGGTAVYGFGASGGLVNVVTKRPEDGDITFSATPGLRLSATHPADSLGSTTALQVSGRTGAVDYLASGSFATRGGHFDSNGDRIPADPTGIQGGLADSNTINLLAKLGTEFDDGRQRVQVTGLWHDFEQDSDFAALGQGGNRSAGTSATAVRGDRNPVNPGTENRNLNLEYTHADILGSAVTAQAYYAELDVVFGKFPGFGQTGIESEKLGSRLTVETPVEAGPVGLDVTWGLDFLHDETGQYVTDGPDIYPYFEQDALAGFAQLDVPVADFGLISGGLRYEHITLDVADFTNGDGDFVRGGELTFKEPLFNVTGTVFLNENLDLYGGFNQGFTVADISRSLSDGNFTSASEAESEVQKTNNYELGLRAAYDRWDGSVVGFYSTSENGTSFDKNLKIVKQPERIWGVEAAVNVDATDALRLGGTVTWMEGVVDTDDDGDYEEDLPALRIPPVKLTAYAEYDVTDWWTARLQALHSGDRNPDSTQFGGTDIDNYTVVDLYSSFAVGPGNLELGVENLFNAEYYPVINQAYSSVQSYQSFSYAQGPGTTVTAAYSLKF